MSRRSDAVATVLMRHEFYRDRFRFMVIIASIFCVLVIISLIVATLAVLTKPERDYYAARLDGVIIPIQPVDVK